MSDTVTVKAKTRFTTALASGEILHMDPNDKRKGAEFKRLHERDVTPADAKKLHNRGWIEDYEGMEVLVLEPTAGSDAPAGNGEKGDNGDSGAKGTLTSLYSSKHVGGGMYEISGPDGFSEKVKGKGDAEKRIVELAKALIGGATVKNHPTGPTAGSDAPAGNGVEGDNGNGEEGNALDAEHGTDRSTGGGNPDEAPAT
ncbi:MAG: hypothetical protein ABW128_06815 [Rhizorhabdus sp.]